jgi:lipid-A-disaccharide synthase
MMKKKIFIIAGEKSGDLLGSKILRQIDKDIFDVEGIGGEMMVGEGLQSLFNMNELSVMGIFEVLPKLFRLLKRIRSTAEYIINTKQDIVLSIDSPDFCFRVMALVKKLDTENRIKKLHFVAPSVWVYRKKRAKKIAKIYDMLFCLLPFEPPYFEKYGLKTIFVGHPIFDKESTEYEFNGKNISYNGGKFISITVGSRKSEVNKLLPIVLDVIERLKLKYKELEYVILATDYTYNLIKDKLKNDYVRVEKDFNRKKFFIKKSILAIAKSGTNVLEFAGYSVPMVTIYKFNFLTNIIAEIIKKVSETKFVNLINVMNKKMVVPEVILGKCTADNVFNEVNGLLDDEEKRLKQIEINAETIKLLGYGRCSSSSEIIVNNIVKFL